MKKGRFTEEQMVAILREVDKTPVGEVARKHKISEQTIYNWRRHVGTLEPADIKRLGAWRARTRSSSASSPNAISRLTPSRKSTAESGELLEVARSALAYRSLRAERDAPTLTAMRRLAAQYPRYGYRRIRIFLHREGHHMSRHRAHRLWRLAKVIIEAWRRPYNAVRPHSSLDYLTPIEFRHRHESINLRAVPK